MKKFVYIGFSLLALLMVWCTIDTIHDASAISTTSALLIDPGEPYLNHALPGAEPRSFAYGVLNGSLHSSPVFSPDGTTLYWSAYDDNGPYINELRLVNGSWNSLSRLELLSGINVYSEPVLSPDGSKLYFLTTAPIDEASSAKENIWVVAREGGAWVNPRPLPAIINTMHVHGSFSVSKSGDLYFSSGAEGLNDIYVARFINDRYTAPQKLAVPVNTIEYEVSPAIAPDGSYLLFSRMPTLADDPRLYITYALPDGSWTEPVLIENIGYALSPAITPDGRYVFYMNSEGRISWRDTSFVNQLHPKLNERNDPYGIKKQRDPLTRSTTGAVDLN